MRLSVLFLVATCVVITTSSQLDVLKWKHFKLTHNKQYRPKEESIRLQIFSENLKEIKKHNAEYLAGKTTYRKGINKFADMTEKEFREYLTLSGPRPNFNFVPLGVHKNLLGEDLPSSIDYRNLSAVNPIKDQGKCGSCWAFSTTGSLESINFLQTDQLLSLSEQNLIDCSYNGGNDGCDGGLMEAAFDYIRDNGLESDSDYPYEAYDGRCKFSKSKSVITIQGYKKIQEGSEAALQSAVAKVGPVSVSVDASEFQLYESGIFKSDTSDISLNHGMVVVGYDSKNGQDYWIVRNSWGKNWGESGYIRIARNVRNQVGIADEASYPVL